MAATQGRRVLREVPVAPVVSRTGCDQVHASLRTRREDSSVAARPQVSLGGVARPPEDRYDATSAEAVAELSALLSSRA